MTGSKTSNKLEKIDRQHFFHPSTDVGAHASGASASRIVTGGEGVYITDIDGRKSLDGFAGLYCVNVGYGRREIAEAIYAQARSLSYYHAYAGHASVPAIRLTEKIIEKAPAGLSHVYYGMSGSDANETQIKLVWYFNNVLGRPQKKKIISRWRGYHGSGVMTGSLTGLPLFHEAFDLPMAPVLHTECPHAWRNAPIGMDEEAYADHCAEQLDKLILAEGPDTVAAFIGEPVMGTGGLIPPPATYWSKIQAVLKRHDVLLIADEVVTAFGRLGHWFGCERYEISPDLITVAKGLTSAYLPLSAVIVSDGVWDVLSSAADKFGVFGHGWTYSAHPLCAAAGLANLEILEREDIVDHVRDIEPYFQNALRERFAEHPMVGEVRGAGLLAAIEFSPDAAERTIFAPSLKVGPQVAAACFEEDLIARAMPSGDILGFAPPLIIDRAEIDELVKRAATAIDRVAARVL